MLPARRAQLEGPRQCLVSSAAAEVAVGLESVPRAVDGARLDRRGGAAAHGVDAGRGARTPDEIRESQDETIEGEVHQRQ